MCEQAPDAITIVFGDEHLTYRKLNDQANQLAYSLQRKKVGSETLVGLCANHSPETLVQVENWSGASVLAIYPDFHAKVFTKNLTAILAHLIAVQVAAECQDKQHAYRPNMTHAMSKMKDTVVLLLDRFNLVPFWNSLWLLISHTLEPVRPNRSYPRKQRVKPIKFAMSYKPIR